MQGNYCSHCGQKASTHRFSLRHIFSHDVIHGFFHVDKGLPYTVKELLVRPGYSVREYVEGKRSQHFNYVTFLLILAAMSLFVQSTVHYKMSAVVLATPEAAAMLDTFQEYYQKYIKVIYFCTIPLYAASTFIIFRSAKQNFAEHLVLNAYKVSGALLLNIILMAITGIVTAQKPLITLTVLSGLIIGVYDYWFYWQYFRREHKHRYLLSLKILLAQVLVALIAIALLGPFFQYKFG